MRRFCQSGLLTYFIIHMHNLNQTNLVAGWTSSDCHRTGSSDPPRSSHYSYSERSWYILLRQKKKKLLETGWFWCKYFLVLFRVQSAWEHWRQKVENRGCKILYWKSRLQVECHTIIAFWYFEHIHIMSEYLMYKWRHVAKKVNMETGFFFKI